MENYDPKSMIHTPPSPTLEEIEVKQEQRRVSNAKSQRISRLKKKILHNMSDQTPLPRRTAAGEGEKPPRTPAQAIIAIGEEVTRSARKLGEMKQESTTKLMEAKQKAVDNEKAIVVQTATDLDKQIAEDAKEERRLQAEKAQLEMNKTQIEINLKDEDLRIHAETSKKRQENVKNQGQQLRDLEKSQVLAQEEIYNKWVQDAQETFNILQEHAREATEAMSTMGADAEETQSAQSKTKTQSAQPKTQSVQSKPKTQSAQPKTKSPSAPSKTKKRFATDTTAKKALFGVGSGQEARARMEDANSLSTLLGQTTKDANGLSTRLGQTATAASKAMLVQISRRGSGKYGVADVALDFDHEIIDKIQYGLCGPELDGLIWIQTKDGQLLRQTLVDWQKHAPLTTTSPEHVTTSPKHISPKPGSPTRLSPKKASPKSGLFGGLFSPWSTKKDVRKEKDEGSHGKENDGTDTVKGPDKENDGTDNVKSPDKENDGTDNVKGPEKLVRPITIDFPANAGEVVDISCRHKTCIVLTSNKMVFRVNMSRHTAMPLADQVQEFPGIPENGVVRGITGIDAGRGFAVLKVSGHVNRDGVVEEWDLFYVLRTKPNAKPGLISVKGRTVNNVVCGKDHLLVEATSMKPSTDKKKNVFYPKDVYTMAVNVDSCDEPILGSRKGALDELCKLNKTHFPGEIMSVYSGVDALSMVKTTKGTYPFGYVLGKSQPKPSRAKWGDFNVDKVVEDELFVLAKTSSSQLLAMDSLDEAPYQDVLSVYQKELGSFKVVDITMGQNFGYALLQAEQDFS